MNTYTVYLSGPMSGVEELNYPAFNAAARALRLIGYRVISPAELDTDVTGLSEKAAWRVFLKRDIKELLSCDAIVLLPGWAESRGATLERSIAQGLGMGVMDLASAVIHAQDYLNEINEINGQPDHTLAAA